MAHVHSNKQRATHYLYINTWGARAHIRRTPAAATMAPVARHCSLRSSCSAAALRASRACAFAGMSINSLPLRSLSPESLSWMRAHSRHIAGSGSCSHKSHFEQSLHSNCNSIRVVCDKLSARTALRQAGKWTWDCVLRMQLKQPCRKLVSTRDWPLITVIIHIQRSGQNGPIWAAWRPLRTRTWKSVVCECVLV